jgi:hypothetical protein
MALGVFGGMIAAELIAVFYMLWHAIGPVPIGNQIRTY